MIYQNSIDSKLFTLVLDEVGKKVYINVIYPLCGTTSFLWLLCMWMSLIFMLQVVKGGIFFVGLRES